MKYATVPKVLSLENEKSLFQQLNLSRKEKKILAVQLERERKEVAKRAKAEQTIQSLQELQFLLHQVHPDIVHAPKLSPTNSSGSNSKASPFVATEDERTNFKSLEKKESLASDCEGHEETKESHEGEDEGDYVKDFSAVLEDVENGYCYL